MTALQQLSNAKEMLSDLFNIPKDVRLLEFKEFKSLLRSKRHVKLIDVSTANEYKELHIPGSVNIDITTTTFSERLDLFDRNGIYFIYCRNGIHSESVLRIMEDMGFRQVYALISGLNAWKGTLERLV